MASLDAYALGQSDLNGFLFADVGVEASGMSLSVLSTLARLGVDPWQEAGRLAKLPRSAAADGLARSIAALPAGLWSLAEATPIAARLVALLPTRGGVPKSLPAVARSRSPSQMAFGVLVVAMLAGLAWTFIGPALTSTKGDDPAGSASSMATIASIPPVSKPTVPTDR